GLMSFNGPEDRGPCRVGVSVADISAAMFTATGIIAALYQREKTGQGTHVDVAMLDSLMAMMEGPIARYTLGGQIQQRAGDFHPVLVPFGTFHAQDGDLVIAAANDRVFGRLCNALGRPEFAADPRFSTAPRRVENRVVLTAEMNLALAGRPLAEWIRIFERDGVTASPINDIAQAVRNPQVRARQMLVDVEHPEFGTLEFPGTP